jgi:hypothetical protein
MTLQRDQHGRFVKATAAARHLPKASCCSADAMAAAEPRRYGTDRDHLHHRRAVGIGTSSSSSLPATSCCAAGCFCSAIQCVRNRLAACGLRQRLRQACWRVRSTENRTWHWRGQAARKQLDAQVVIARNLGDNSFSYARHVCSSVVL